MKKLNVALIGYKFMGKAHSYALLATPFFFKTGIEPVRKVIWSAATRGRSSRRPRISAGRNTRPIGAKSCGGPTSTWSTSPRRPARTPRSPSPPPRPANTSSARSRSRSPWKKPSGRWRPCERAGVKHMLGFNYRRVPAIGLAKRLIESGRLGKIYPLPRRLSAGLDHGPAVPADLEAEQGDCRVRSASRIEQPYHRPGAVPGRQDQPRRGHGRDVHQAAAGGSRIGAAVDDVDGSSRFVAAWWTVDVDDTTAFLARFADGAVGTFESTRFAAGRRNHNRVEVNGSKGSVYFDLENMNLLEYYNVDDPADVPGFRTIQVNEGCHPYIDHWWPPGHGIGYQNTFVNQFADFFQAIVERHDSPQPGFEVGLENQKVLEAVTRSIADERWIDI